MRWGEKERMRKSILMAVALALVCVAFAPVFAAVQTTGNGSPSGAHYNLNIIGVPDNNPGNTQGSVIFVSRTGSTTFYVHGGDSYEVLDHNGMDGSVGTGRLDPGIIFPYDATASPTWRVQIWVRLQGPQDSSVHWLTKYWDGSTYAFWSEFTLKKDAPSKFTEKTGALLADGFQDMLWQLDTKTNFRICQMRIYLLD